MEAKQKTFTKKVKGDTTGKPKTFKKKTFANKGPRDASAAKPGKKEDFLNKRKKVNPNPQEDKYASVKKQIIEAKGDLDALNKAVENACNVIKKDGVEKVIQSKSGSMLFQSCVKHGVVKTKNYLVQQFLKLDIVPIAKDKYGHFVITKIMRPEVKRNLVDEMTAKLCEHFDELILDPNGAKVLHFHFEKLNDTQELEMIYSATGEEPNPVILAKIAEELEFSLSCYQAYAWRFWDQLGDSLQENIIKAFKASFESFKETRLFGSLLFCKAFDILELKERKKFLSATITGKVFDIIKYNPNFVLAFIKIYCTFDDHKNMKEQILKEIGGNFSGFLVDLEASKLIMFMFTGDFDNDIKKRFSKAEVGEKVLKECSSNHGKKPLEKKAEDAQNFLLTECKVLDGLQADPQAFLKLCKENLKFCQVFGSILKEILNRESCEGFVDFFISLLLENTTSYINGDLEAQEDALIVNPFGQRLVKRFIQNLEQCDSDRKSIIEKKLEEYVALVNGSLSKFFESRAVFIVIALIENTSYGEIIALKVKKLLKKGKISKENLELPGMKILAKIIKG